MEPYIGNWLVLLMNAIVIASLLTAPLLVGILIIRVLRKGVSKDRQAFEEEIKSKIDQIAESQAEIKQQLDELLRR